MSAEPTPDIRAVAEALGIPWRRILQSEIDSERALRQMLGGASADEPLWRILCALPSSALDSWRVRERVNALACEASSGRAPAAARELKEVFDYLRGRRKGRQSSADLASHFWFAYQRVQELVGVAGAAEKARGDHAWRIRRTAEVSGCSSADARWAVDRADSPGRGHRLDDTIARARSEGFEIPRAGTPMQSFVLLRRLARKSAPFPAPATRRRAASKGKSRVTQVLDGPAPPAPARRPNPGWRDPRVPLAASS